MWAIVVEEAAVGFAHAVVAPIERWIILSIL
ncbi:MAG: hypothetical protein METHSR3v1_70001 [Methanothrix sp.]|jgi:hypothetical protein|nr:MAG: hypothetical protein METHSR3v1_70001 [Methanothrix sp.]